LRWEAVLLQVVIALLVQAREFVMGRATVINIDSQDYERKEE